MFLPFNRKVKIVNFKQELVDEFNPLKDISFFDSIDANKFGEAIQARADHSARYYLDGIKADGAILTLHSMQLFQNNRIYTLSKNGQRMLDAGQATIAKCSKTGRDLADLKSTAKGKKFIEKMRRSTGAEKAAKLTSIATLVVSAAHMISGADLSKRIVNLQGGVQDLHEFRKIDQLAKLERIYVQAREIISSKDADRTTQLRGLRGELTELRSVWRNEVIYKLNQITDPRNDSWFTSMFSSTNSTDKKVWASVSKFEMHFWAIEYATRLDNLIAILSGAEVSFLKNIHDELSQIDELSIIMKNKVNYISDKGKVGFSVDSIVPNLDEYTESYRSYIAAYESVQTSLYGSTTS